MPHHRRGRGSLTSVCFGKRRRLRKHRLTRRLRRNSIVIDLGTFVVVSIGHAIEIGAISCIQRTLWLPSRVRIEFLENHYTKATRNSPTEFVWSMASDESGLPQNLLQRRCRVVGKHDGGGRVAQAVRVSCMTITLGHWGREAWTAPPHDDMYTCSRTRPFNWPSRYRALPLYKTIARLALSPGRLTCITCYNEVSAISHEA